MKKIISLFSLAFFAALSLNATVWTVSFDSRPAQFTNLQIAHDTASAGDTILVNGYGGGYTDRAAYSLTAIKPLVLIGENIDGGISNTATTAARTTIYQLNLSRLNAYTAADNFKVYGIDILRSSVNPSFSGAQVGEANLSNILFERCRISNLNFLGASDYSYSNITFRNCVISSSTRFSSAASTIYSNVLITNCVINGYVVGDVANSFNGGIVVRNNVFIDRTNTYCFNGTKGLIVENNIFYRSEPTGCTDCTFNNNLTYLCLDNSLPSGSGSVGSGNIENADPLWIAYPALGDAAWSTAHNYGIQVGSPAIGTGTNGTNIGLSGGNAPVNQIPFHPKTPEVVEIDIPVSSVPAGGTLQINLKARTRD